MAECNTCGNYMSVEDLIRRSAKCNADGKVSFVGAEVNQKYIIPQRFITNAGTEYNFEPASAWTVARGLITDDTDNFKSGTQSLKINANQAGLSGYGSFVFPQPFNFNGEAPKGMRLWFYLYDTVDKFSRVEIQLTSTDFTKRFTASVNTAKQGWNEVEIIAWTNTGGESWSNNLIKMRLSVVPTTGNTCIASFDNMLFGIELQPAIMLTFDDSNVSVYDNAFPFMQLNKVKGTFYQITSKIGGVEKCTAEQLLEMDASGWSIANHSDTADDLSLLSAADIVTHLTTAKTTLDGLGLTKASQHVAYPNGNRNATVDAAMVTAEMLTGRISGAGAYANDIADYNYRIGTIASMGSGYSLVQAKADVDLILSGKKIGVFLCHGIVTENNDAYTWLKSDFEALVNYIKSKSIPIITINDYYLAQSQSIEVAK